jgi:thioredoxin 1
VVRVLIGAAIGAVLGGLAGLLVKLSAKNQRGRTQWAFVGSPGRGAILGAVVGIFFGLYFGGPYGWRPEEQSNVVPLTADTFDTALHGPKPLIAVFYSETCPTCRGFAPTVERLADEYEGRITVARVQAEGQEPLFGRLGITLYPTTLYFANGEQVGQTKGAVRLAGLRKRANALLAQQAAPPETPEQPTSPEQPLVDEPATGTAGDNGAQ